MFWSPVAGSNSPWVRLAVERSAPVRFAPERSASERFASVRFGSICGDLCGGGGPDCAKFVSKQHGPPACGF